jgi:hypothetical protein
MLGGLAESKRDLIRGRTGEGRARAAARGQKMGRPFKLIRREAGAARRRPRFHQPQRPGKCRVEFLNGFVGCAEKICRLGTCCEFTSAQILEHPPEGKERIVT